MRLRIAKGEWHVAPVGYLFQRASPEHLTEIENGEYGLLDRVDPWVGLPTIQNRSATRHALSIYHICSEHRELYRKGLVCVPKGCLILIVYKNGTIRVAGDTAQTL